jgi:deazaflavin-dependent oxidoreductase (nitroreductase family)
MDDAIRKALSRGHTIDITTRGRRTGQPRRIEIVFHNFGGRLFISGMPSLRKRAWLANLEADPNFTFHLKDPAAPADLPATARVITDEAERRAIMAQVAGVWGRRDVDTMVAFSPLVEVSLADEAA